MPLHTKIELPDGCRVAVWEILETAEELIVHAPLSASELERYNTYTHEGRKRQWLGCRAALRHLLTPASAAEISYDGNGKPHLTNHAGHISLSHTRRFAAAVFHPVNPVGIDIEELRDRIERVKERFLRPADLAGIGDVCRLEKLYIHWGARESLYKLHGIPGTDFQHDIIVQPFTYLCDTSGSCPASLITNDGSRDYTVWYTKLDGHMLTVAYSL